MESEHTQIFCASSSLGKKEPSEQKSGSNIVVEWMTEIRDLARDGYTISSGYPRIKDERFQRIIGICDAVIMVLKEN